MLVWSSTTIIVATSEPIGRKPDRKYFSSSFHRSNQALAAFSTGGASELPSDGLVFFAW